MCTLCQGLLSEIHAQKIRDNSRPSTDMIGKILTAVIERGDQNLKTEVIRLGDKQYWELLPSLEHYREQIGLPKLEDFRARKCIFFDIPIEWVDSPDHFYVGTIEESQRYPSPQLN